MIINTFPCLVEPRWTRGGRASRDSSRTRRMTGNRRRVRCEAGSGRGGQQDGGRRGEEGGGGRTAERAKTAHRPSGKAENIQPYFVLFLLSDYFALMNIFAIQDR